MDKQEIFLLENLCSNDIVIQVDSPNEAKSTLSKLFSYHLAVVDGCNIIRKTPPLGDLNKVTNVQAKSNGLIELVFGNEHKVIDHVPPEYRISFSQFSSDNSLDDYYTEHVAHSVKLEARKNRLCFLMDNMFRDIELEDIAKMSEEAIEGIEALFAEIQGQQRMPKFTEDSRPVQPKLSDLGYSKTQIKTIKDVVTKPEVVINGSAFSLKKNAGFTTKHSSSIEEKLIPTEFASVSCCAPRGEYPYSYGNYFYINDGSSTGIYVVNIWYENLKHLIDNGVLSDTVQAIVFTSHIGIKCAYITDERVPDKALHDPYFCGCITNPDVLRFHTVCPTDLCICEHDVKSAINWTSVSYKDINNNQKNYPTSKNGTCVECSQRFSWIGNGDEGDDGMIYRN